MKYRWYRSRNDPAVLWHVQWFTAKNEGKWLAEWWHYFNNNGPRPVLPIRCDGSGKWGWKQK